MKKNLFEQRVTQQIIERAAHIQEGTQPLWGTMTAGEMLRHCSSAIAVTLSAPKETKPTTLKQHIARFAMLNFITAFPKGAKTPDMLNMKKNNLSVYDLPTELKNFNDHVQLFAQHQLPIRVRHPYFGNMNQKQWGILTWMHLDHHLRQFGV